MRHDLLTFTRGNGVFANRLVYKMNVYVRRNIYWLHVIRGYDAATLQPDQKIIQNGKGTNIKEIKRVRIYNTPPVWWFPPPLYPMKLVLIIFRSITWKYQNIKNMMYKLKSYLNGRFVNWNYENYSLQCDTCTNKVKKKKKKHEKDL